jgi:hypothetical protein
MNLPKNPDPYKGLDFQQVRVQVRSKKTQGYPCHSLVPVALATAHTTVTLIVTNIQDGFLPCE